MLMIFLISALHYAHIILKIIESVFTVYDLITQSEGPTRIHHSTNYETAIR